MLHLYYINMQIFTNNITYTGCISESDDFINVINGKSFHLFSFNTYQYNAYIKWFIFLQFQFNPFNTLKTKVLLSENNIIQMTTILL
jgi:hypothetical protein